jgi:hypothetical protein
MKLVPVDVGTGVLFTRQPTDASTASFLAAKPLEPLHHRCLAEYAYGFHFDKPYIFLIPHHK